MVTQIHDAKRTASTAGRATRPTQSVRQAPWGRHSRHRGICPVMRAAFIAWHILPRPPRLWPPRNMPRFQRSYGCISPKHSETRRQTAPSLTSRENVQGKVPTGHSESVHAERMVVLTAECQLCSAQVERRPMAESSRPSFGIACPKPAGHDVTPKLLLSGDEVGRGGTHTRPGAEARQGQL